MRQVRTLYANNGSLAAQVTLREADVAKAQAEVARATDDYNRRAALVAKPSDPLEARYQLARALARAGDAAAARREILSVLESAPAFEKAQALLLQLSGRSPQGNDR